MRTTTSLQETTTFILPGVCVALGWKMARHSTHQQKQEEPTTSRDIIPAKLHIVFTWLPVVSVLPSSLDKQQDLCGTGTMATGVN